MSATLRAVLVGAALLGYAVASHLLFTQVEKYARLAILWIWLPLAGACVLMTWRSAWRWRVVGLLTGATVFIWLATANMGIDPGFIFMIQYLAVQAGLAGLFGLTLRSGRQPLVTRLARAVHGHLPPAIERYTRTVTLVWTLFFITLGTVATVLYVFTAKHWWSIWVNFLTPLFIGALFVVEYAARRRLFPDFKHSSFSTAMRAFQHDLDRGKAD